MKKILRMSTISICIKPFSISIQAHQFYLIYPFKLIPFLIYDYYNRLNLFINNKQRTNKMNVQINKQSTHRSNNNPLIFIQEASVAIFADKIIKYSKLKHKNSSVINTTVFSLNQIDPQDKILQFSKNDLAFKVTQHLKKVQIIRLKSQKIQVQFTIQKASILTSVHEVLRRKLCQVGFQQKFTIIKELGRGATAKVYLVIRKSDNKKFAAKIISLKQSENKDYQTFINEAKILKCLKNIHILAIQSLYISKKQLISVLQYLSGNTLLEELKTDAIKTKSQRLKVIKDIADGLQHLRQKRIAHRDLKLQNVMIRRNMDKSKDYVITDFGLACWIGEKNLIYQKCGTPGYIAPQILRSAKGKVIVSHNSDMFSLGVICHFIFLLKALFPYNGSPRQLLILNKKAQFSLQNKIYLTLSSCQHQILKKTLELDPSKRITSQQFAKTTLLNYEEEIGVSIMKKQKQRILKTQEKEREASIKKNRIHLSNSIQVIEKRATSIEKAHFSNRQNIQKNKQKQQIKRQKKSDSLFSKLWNKISSSQALKTKQHSIDRRKQMKKFLQ